MNRKIVYLDVTTADLREALRARLPAGFDLTLAEAATEEQTAAAVADADYVLCWAAKMPTRVIQAMRKARLIQKIGEGTDRIDVATAAEMGITVAKTTGSNSVSVAEGATLLMLAALRWLPNLHNAVVAGRFPKFDYRESSYELRDKQVGIVGIGKIGRSVAEQMQGFHARVAYYDVVRLPQAEETRLECPVPGAGRTAAHVRRGHLARAADPGHAQLDRRAGARVDEAHGDSRQYLPRAGGG